MHSSAVVLIEIDKNIAMRRLSTCTVQADIICFETS